MEKITVSDELQSEIMEQIRNLKFSPAPGRRIVVFHSRKRYAAAAAAAVIILGTAVLTVPGLLNQQKETPPTVEDGIFDIEEVSSLAELANVTGLPLKELTGLPFEITGETYTAYGTELAEITYSGGSQTLCYRVSAGTDDNSGDYNEYNTETQTDINGLTLTLKGNDGKFSLAVWTDGTYSYSISLTEGIDQEALLEMITASSAS